jgi:Protein of unknown function (DUF1579)
MNFELQPPDKELQRLSPLIGKWTTTEKTQDSILGSGLTVHSVEEFYWLDGGYFLVSTYHTVFGKEPAQTGIMYWGYDADKGQFHNRFFSNNGAYTTEGNEYQGKVEGNKLTFVGPAKFQYELDHEGKIQLNPDGSITVIWWLQNEKEE